VEWLFQLCHCHQETELTLCCRPGSSASSDDKPGPHRVSTRHSLGCQGGKSRGLFVFYSPRSPPAESLAARGGPGAVCDTTWGAKTRDADIRHRQPPSSRHGSRHRFRRGECRFHTLGPAKFGFQHRSLPLRIKLTQLVPQSRVVSRRLEAGLFIWSCMGRHQGMSMSPHDGNSPRKTSHRCKLVPP